MPRLGPTCNTWPSGCNRCNSTDLTTLRQRACGVARILLHPVHAYIHHSRDRVVVVAAGPGGGGALRVGSTRVRQRRVVARRAVKRHHRRPRRSLRPRRRVQFSPPLGGRGWRLRLRILGCARHTLCSRRRVHGRSHRVRRQRHRHSEGRARARLSPSARRGCSPPWGTTARTSMPISHFPTRSRTTTAQWSASAHAGISAIPGACRCRRYASTTICSNSCSASVGACAAIVMRAKATNGGTLMTESYDRLCVLADSLPGAIRWRFCDYEQLLKKQLQLLASPSQVVRPLRDHDDRGPSAQRS